MFVCGQQSHEATMAVEHLPAAGIACRGELLGKPYALEALSRRRLPGDTEDATRVQFAGSFEHEDGPSGDFTIAERANGELMALGFYGAPSSVRVVKVQRSLAVCPVQVTGLGKDIEIRLESPGDPLLSPIAESAKRMRPFAAANSYVGYCMTKKEYSDEAVPMPALLTTLVLASELILRRYYLKVDAS